MFPNNPSDWRPVEPSPSTAPISQPVSTSTPRRNDGPRHASLAATLLAVAVFGALIGFAADRWISASPNPSIAPVAAAAPTTALVAPAAQPAPTVGSSPRVGARAAQQTGSPTATPAAAGATTTATDPQTQAIQQVVQAVLAAGKVPIIPTINYTNDANHNANIPAFNLRIYQLYTEFPQIIRGPDFWSYFRNNSILIKGGDIVVGGRIERVRDDRLLRTARQAKSGA